MPYEKSVEKLRALVEQVLTAPANSEIREGLANSEIEESALYRAITKDAKDIWAVVSSETSEYDSNQYKLQAEETKLATLLGPEPDPQNASTLAARQLPFVVISIVAVSAFATIAIGWWFKGLRGTFAWLWYSTAGFIWFIFLAILIFGSLLMNFYFERLRRIRLEIVRRSLKEEQAKWLAQKETQEESLGIKRLRSTLADLESMIAQSVIEKKIKPRLRFMINRGLAPSYDKDFYIIGASGLAEVFDPSHAIDTSAKQRLRFMLENTAGGSIGIAGPRGAGKTTLILSYCGPKPTVDNLKGLPLLSVLASAPVEYQGRDFILYLFSAVCHRVLELHGASDDQAGLQEAEAARNTLIDRTLNVFAPFSKHLVYAGSGLIVLSLFFAGLFAKYPPPAKASDEPKPAAVATAGQVTPAATPANPIPLEPTIIRLIRALDISPSPLFMWGILIGLVGWVVEAGVRARLRREQFEVWERSRAEKNFDPGNISPTLQVKDLQTREVIIQESRRWLRKIKFQQSYTSGWSGALKLPVGLEGGVNSAVTLAENQLSLPEIVHNFTRYLVQLSAHYQVIIGIDELDKLESDDKAQRFLNEIKSIFGLERCFYLISVSENAMSNFERRGLPFRDAFDSSFDNIIYVDYLSFMGAKRLLAERVTGKPIPFFGLSYCLAGGLPRDLIRHFRHLVELSERDGQAGAPPANDITSLCQELVSADLKAKIRAVSVAAKRLELEPEAGEFLEEVYRLDVDPPDAVQMLTIASEISLPMAELAPTEANTELLNKRHKLANLKSELATYCFYLATLLQFFNNNLQQAVLEPCETEGGGLDQLARARQVLAVDPDITFNLLNRFRGSNQLAALPSIPKPPVMPPPPAPPPINNTAGPVA